MSIDKRQQDRALMREIAAFIAEVTIAGEVPIDDLYADYRPEDPKEYLGMTPKADDSEGGDFGDGGGDGDDINGAPKTGGGGFDDRAISFDGDDDSDSADISISTTSSSTSTHEHIYYTMMHRNSRFFK